MVETLSEPPAMPDLTLYADDAETIIQALWARKAVLYATARKVIVDEETYDEIGRLDSLADKMTERVAQGRHPIRKG